MKPDRMAAYEAPHPDPPPSRYTDPVIVRHRAAKGHRIDMKVYLPGGMSRPDVLTHRGRTYVKREKNIYTEAVVWPIFEELDAVEQ